MTDGSGIAKRRQFDQPGALRVSRRNLSGDLYGKPGLPDAADTGEGDKPGVRQQLCDFGEMFLTAEEARRLRREITRRLIESLQRREILLQPFRDDLIKPLRLREITQAMLTKIDEVKAFDDRCSRCRN